LNNNPLTLFLQTAEIENIIPITILPINFQTFSTHLLSGLFILSLLYHACRNTTIVRSDKKISTFSQFFGKILYYKF